MRKSTIKTFVIPFALIGVFFISALPLPSLAHSGRTASDGCHYCRTNCDSWGVAWNQRHCHNGYVAPVVKKPVAPKPIVPKPVEAPAPTPQPIQPTIKPLVVEYPEPEDMDELPLLESLDLSADVNKLSQKDDNNGLMALPIVLVSAGLASVVLVWFTKRRKKK